MSKTTGKARLTAEEALKWLLEVHDENEDNDQDLEMECNTDSDSEVDLNLNQVDSSSEVEDHESEDLSDDEVSDDDDDHNDESSNERMEKHGRLSHLKVWGGTKTKIFYEKSLGQKSVTVRILP